MVKVNLSDSESAENINKSSSNEVEKFTDNDDSDNDKENDGMTEYEKQRLSRIQENRARLEALRLPNLAATLSSGSKGKIKQQKLKKGKVGKKSKKDDDDDDYVQPSDGEEEIRGKNIQSPNRRKSRKQLHWKNTSESGSICDEEKALMQAIALSHEGSEAVNQETRQFSQTKGDAGLTKRKGGGKVKENDGRRKIIKPNTSRAQMTEDQVIIHFFQFDEAGKGSITKRDLQRVAIEHDFSWSNEEMAAMIHCFDSDGDEKVSISFCTYCFVRILLVH
ncbi:hypothetical protein MKX01_030928 [Papaver californicum]|nr:hypothetical protein MKX01_030928 [Papaver californicum]